MKNLHYVGRHSAARLGRGFQTRPCQYVNVYHPSIGEFVFNITTGEFNWSSVRYTILPIFSPWQP